MAETARLFVSVEVPVTDALLQAMKDLDSVRGVRASKPEQIHITLCFLGDTDVRRIPELVGNLKAELSDAHRFRMTIKGIGGFPNLKRPRVVWAGTEDGGSLSVLAEKVRRAADRTHLDYDGKRFSPHVTVARVQGPADVKEVADRYSDTVFAETEVDTVRLMRSVLLPSGARHTVVESIPLL